MFHKLIALCIFLSLSLGALLGPQKPSRDDFYKPTWGYERAKPGEVLKFREAPAKIRSIYFPVNVKNAWQLLVRSEDAFGKPNAIVTTVFEPHNGNSSRLVSYQVAEDAANIDCSPSYVFMNGGNIGTIPNQFEMILIQSALDQGFYVVAPDHETDISAFISGKVSGLATLNSIRGALNSGNKTNVDPNAEVVLWGYSGGSVPASWAAGLQPKYAPELKGQLKGATYGGWVTNITAVAETIEGTVFAGFVASAIHGISNQYPDLQEVIDEKVKWYKKPKFNLARETCITWSIASYLFTRFFSGPFRYVDEGWDIFHDERVKKVMDQNILGNDLNKDVKPEIPIFLFQGKFDEVVPYKHAERVFNVWCGQGMDSFEFATSITSGHVTEVVEASGAALGWINSIFEGKTPVQGCIQTNRINTLFHPSTFGGVVDIVKATLKNVLGFEIGPNDKDSDIIERFLKGKGINLDQKKKENNS